MNVGDGRTALVVTVAVAIAVACLAITRADIQRQGGVTGQSGVTG
jgi:hypothetical protein